MLGSPTYKFQARSEQAASLVHLLLQLPSKQNEQSSAKPLKTSEHYLKLAIGDFIEHMFRHVDRFRLEKRAPGL
jgi:hypothetical protein